MKWSTDRVRSTQTYQRHKLRTISTVKKKQVHKFFNLFHIYYQAIFLKSSVYAVLNLPVNLIVFIFFVKKKKNNKFRIQFYNS